MSTKPNRDLVNQGFDLLQAALVPFVGRELKARLGKTWFTQGVYYSVQTATQTKLMKDGDEVDLKGLDLAALLFLINHNQNWNDVFKLKLGAAERSWVNELRDTRNDLAHLGSTDVPDDKARRALDTIQLLVTSVDPTKSPQAEILTKRLQALSHAKSAPAPLPPTPSADVPPVAVPATTVTTPPATQTLVPVQPPAPTPTQQKAMPLGLKPWREVVTPHRDVSGGTYSNAEFAADLSSILSGSAEPEYGDPTEFFGRTFLTEGMRLLLSSALQRLAGKGGEPVVQLKTAFGGGKTHSMIALFHLANSRGKAHTYPGLSELYKQAGVTASQLPGAKVAVLVGTALDGTRVGPDAGGNGVEVRTLWGEMAAQLGGASAYAHVAEADRTGVAPGSDTLVRLFEQVGPCLVLIDELVAYARKIHGVPNVPGGSFESQMSFVQSLTEAAKRAPRCLVVVSTPESDTETGGEAGKEAQDRLEKILGRVESIWKPVGAVEGFEIVRRRLFDESQVDPEARDAACRAVAKLYASHTADFPADSRTTDYLERIRSAYPIHPEIFDRLYNDWSTLEKFQRTRGVLRLMAHVINALWAANDRSALIMPGSIPLDHPNVQGELTRYLPEGWTAILDGDVDGVRSEPYKIEQQYMGTIGKHLAARRVARTIFLGTAPHGQSQRVRGMDAARVRLGVVQPSEGISTFNDALGHLTERCTYLYSGDGRYWYDTRPNLRRTAADRAGEIEEYRVTEEVQARLKAMTKDRADFAGVHLFAGSADIPDEPAVRLVVLSPGETHRGNKDESLAVLAARKILDSRGLAPRLMKNMLVFVAADDGAVQAMHAEARQYLAWQWIRENAAQLNLDEYGRKEAKESETRSDDTLRRRVNEAYVWLLVPSQRGIGPWEWKADKIAGNADVDTFVVRAARKLKSTEGLITQWSPALVKMELDRHLWKDGADHYETKRLWEALTNYGYMPRLANVGVLRDAVAAGLRSGDHFAYADSVSPTGRYEGLSFNDARSTGSVLIGAPSVLVKPEIAIRQLEADEAAERERKRRAGDDKLDDDNNDNDDDGGITPPKPPLPPKRAVLDRFYGSVQIDAQRPIAKFSDVVNEVAQHLTSLPDAEVTITVTIEALVPGGASEQTVRTVTENAKTLKFQQSAFDEG